MTRTPDGQMHYDPWDVLVALGILAGTALLFFL